MRPRRTPGQGLVSAAQALKNVLGITGLRPEPRMLEAVHAVLQTDSDLVLAMPVGHDRPARLVRGLDYRFHFFFGHLVLVDQLDRAFSNPEKSGRAQGQIEKLKCWLPIGMSFHIGADSKPTKPRKTKKAA